MHTRISIIAILAASSMSALAVEPHQPELNLDLMAQGQMQKQAQLSASALHAAINVDAGAASADAEAISNAQGGRALAGSNSGSEINIGGDEELNTYRSTSRALALTLPGLVAAPAVPGECRVHHAGWGLFSAGKTGSTSFDDACLARQHCLNLADRYAAWGLIDVAARQLRQCGGVQADVSMKDRTPAPAAAPIDMSSYVSREELAEHEARIVRGMLSK